MRPNIIIFNPDQFRSDALAHLGNPASSTPFLDEFAAHDAVSFRNAFCQNPVCVPSRCSFFTGLYPHTKGHRTMQYLLHDHEPNLFGELKAAGYHVWMNDRNDLFAGQVPGLMEANADEICYSNGQVKAMGTVDPDPRGNPEGKQYYSHYMGQLKTDETGRSYSPDDLSVDTAIDRILHPVDDKPLCMFLGLFYPHPPYNAEEPYFSMIDRSKLSRRADIGTGKPLLEAKLREYMHMEAYTEDDWNEMRAVYLGMCRKVDDQFKRLCDALKEAGIYDNSAIFFFSDHGDYTGDYGIPEKAQNTFEDCLTKVPLLIKPPKDCPVDAGVTDSLAELVDFYATAMDFAGVEPNHDQFGKSLRPIIGDRKAELRDFVCCEGGRMPGEFQSDEYHAAAGKRGFVPTSSTYYPRQMAQRDDDAHTKGTMIRTKDAKYIHRAFTGAHEYYDLKADPLEEHNIFAEKADTPEVLKLQLKLLDWYQKTCDTVPREYDRRQSPEAMWKSVENICPPELEEKIRQLIASGVGPVILRTTIGDYIKQQKGK